MTTLEERVQALEERECYDDTDIKEKMGYNDVPSGSNIQAEIDALEPEYVKSLFEDMLDEAILDENNTSVTRTLSFSVKTTDNYPVSLEAIYISGASDTGEHFQETTDSAGECTMSDVPDEDYLMYLNDFASQDVVSVNGESPVIEDGYIVLTVNESSTSFDIIVIPQQQ